MTSITTLEDIVARVGVRVDDLAAVQKELAIEAAAGRKEVRQALIEAAVGRKELEQFLKGMSAEAAADRKELEQFLKGMSAEAAAGRKELEQFLKGVVVEAAASKVETDKIWAETNKIWAETNADMKRMLKDLRTECGGLGHKLGQLTELVVVPGIRPEMNALGHKFRYVSANKKIKADGKVVAEVDAFLHNGVEAMAAEVKTTLTTERVNVHLNRLRTLREYEVAAGLRNKVLYGAVVGLVVEKHARKLALKEGLYVVEIMDCPESLEVESPKCCRRW